MSVATNNVAKTDDSTCQLAYVRSRDPIESNRTLVNLLIIASHYPSVLPGSVIVLIRFNSLCGADSRGLSRHQPTTDLSLDPRLLS